MGGAYDPPEPTDKGLETKEAVAYAAGDNIAERKAESDFKRDDQFHNALNKCVTVVMCMIVLALGWGVAALAWYYLMPDAWQYLSEKQVDKIQTLLGTAIFSSVLTGYVNKKMGR